LKFCQFFIPCKQRDDPLGQLSKGKKQISSTMIIEGTTEKVLQLNVYNQNSAFIKQKCSFENISNVKTLRRPLQ
jgi:hypothetical protein